MLSTTRTSLERHVQRSTALHRRLHPSRPTRRLKHSEPLLQRHYRPHTYSFAASSIHDSYLDGYPVLLYLVWCHTRRTHDNNFSSHGIVPPRP